MPRGSRKIDPPTEFSIARELAPGRYALFHVFPGLGQVPAFRALSKDAAERAVLQKTSIEVVPQDLWMYVAPREAPKEFRRGRWQPVVSAEDCVVVGKSHLSESAALIVYLDILHELCHILQRHHGRELWDQEYAYVDRPTELEAYEVAVHEARRLGAGEAFLRDYLKVEWVTAKDFQRLLKHLGVAAS